jgi:hypothetical protein
MAFLRKYLLACDLGHGESATTIVFAIGLVEELLPRFEPHVNLRESGRIGKLLAI